MTPPTISEQIMEARRRRHPFVPWSLKFALPRCKHCQLFEAAYQHHAPNCGCYQCVVVRYEIPDFETEAKATKEDSSPPSNQ